MKKTTLKQLAAIKDTLANASGDERAEIIEALQFILSEAELDDELNAAESHDDGLDDLDTPLDGSDPDEYTIEDLGRDWY